MIVGTTEAVKILQISSARLRILLIAGRVEGAYKSGKMWLIPLFQGKPSIRRGSRGPDPRWCNPRKPAKTVIHVNTEKGLCPHLLPLRNQVPQASSVNSHRIRANKKNQQHQPVITVKQGNTNQYGHEVEIPGGCRIIYNPHNPIHGAKVWIESLYEVKVISFEP